MGGGAGARTFQEGGVSTAAAAAAVDADSFTATPVAAAGTSTDAPNAALATVDLPAMPSALPSRLVVSSGTMTSSGSTGQLPSAKRSKSKRPMSPSLLQQVGHKALHNQIMGNINTIQRSNSTGSIDSPSSPNSPRSKLKLSHCRPAGKSRNAASSPHTIRRRYTVATTFGDGMSFGQLDEVRV